MRAPWLVLMASVGCNEVADAGKSATKSQPVDACTVNATAPTTRVRRLTKAELGAAVAPLLGEDAALALEDVDADPRIDDRYSNSDRLIATTGFLGGLYLVADRLGSDFKATVAPGAHDSTCFGSDAAAESCARTFIRTFGERAYRRSLSDDDINRLMPVYTAGREVGIDGDAGDRFASGLSWVVRAMLQAPDFLYLTELGDPAAAPGETTRLLEHEIASFVSFSVVGMPPDAALVTAAAENRLAARAEREEQAARLIAAYPEGWKRQMRRFVTEWLGINFEKLGWAKDPVAAPLFSPSLKEALKVETDLFIDDWATQADGARLDRLLTGTSTFVNEVNAPLYGLSAVGPAFQKTNLNPAERAGILTLGGFLGSTSHGSETSPVLRGLVILERLLCGELPPPPAMVPPLPRRDASPPTTTRARFETHLADPTCRGCHELIDPMGNAFEAYDVVGAHRTEENGFPVDSSGSLLSSDGSQTPVASAVELVNALAASPEVQACVARQLFRFTVGRDETAADACTLDDATHTLTAGSGTLADVVLAFVGSDAFVTRQVNR